MDSRLLQVFCRLVGEQCRVALSSFDIVGRMLVKDGIPFNSERFWANVQTAMVATANVSKACWGEGERKADERRDLRDVLQISDESPLKSTSARNHFEHIDERVDRWFATTQTHSFADRNVGPTGSIQGMDAIDLFRFFDTDVAAFTFWGNVYPLRPIVGELIRVEARTKDVLACRGECPSVRRTNT